MHLVHHVSPVSRFAIWPQVASADAGRDLLVTVGGGQNLALRGSHRGLKPQGVRRVRGYCWTFARMRYLHPPSQGDGDGRRDGGPPSTPLPPPYRGVSPLPFPSESTLSYHGPFPIDWIGGKVLDPSVRMSLYAYAAPTQPESCVCATANRLTISPPRRMIGACSTRGTYRDVWQIPGAAKIERCKIAPSPVTGRSPPGKAPAGPPTATPDADPLFAALGNVRPSPSAGGSDGLVLAVPADCQERGCMTGEFEWT